MANSYPASGNVTIDKLMISNKVDRAYTPNSFNDTLHAMHIDFCNQNQRAGLIRWTSHGNLENSFGVVQVGCAAAGCGQGDFVFQAYREAGGATYSELMRLTNTGNVGIGSCDFTRGGFNAKMLIKQTSNGDWTGLQISDAADENVINFGYNGTDFIISQSWRQCGGPTKNLKIGLGCQLFLKTDGKVAVGSTSPNGQLSVAVDQSVNNQHFNIVGTQASYNQEYSFGIPTSTKDLRIYDGTAGAVRFTLTCLGNIGIGCTTPTNTLEVNGTGRFACTVNIGTSASSASRFQLNFQNWNATNSYPYITFQNPAANCRHGIGINTSDNFVIGRATGVDCNFAHQDFVIVNSTGNTGINTTTPGSYKLYVNGAFYSAGSSCEYKTQICQYNTDSCMFMKLTPVTYQYKDEWSYLGKELKSETQIGLIAEDVAEVYPELAMMKEDIDGEKRVRNVDYEKLSIILLSELQKLRAEVDELKTK